MDQIGSAGSKWSGKRALQPGRGAEEGRSGESRDLHKTGRESLEVSPGREWGSLPAPNGGASVQNGLREVLRAGATLFDGSHHKFHERRVFPVSLLLKRSRAWITTEAKPVSKVPTTCARATNPQPWNKNSDTLT